MAPENYFHSIISRASTLPSRAGSFACLARFARQTKEKETARNLTSALIGLIIYSKKLLNSDWLRKECSSSRGSLRACSPIGASLARTRVLARLTSLAQIGELARRLFWG